MIVKSIKKYKKGNGFRYEISINKKDLEDLNNPKKVNILTNKECEYIQNEIKDLKQIIANQDKELEQSYKKQHNIEENNKTIRQLEEIHQETIENLNQQQHKTIKELDQQHINQLKESYEQFNKDLAKYITINQYKTQH